MTVPKITIKWKLVLELLHYVFSSTLFGTWGSLILDIAVAPYYIYQFQDLFSLFYSTGETATRDDSEGIATTSTGPQRHKRQLGLGLSHFLIRGLIQKRTAVDSTVSSMELLLILTSFFASTRMLITFYRPIYQVTGYLHTVPPPTCRRNPCPPGISIGTCNIQDVRGCGLAHDIYEAEQGGLDLM